MTADKIRLDEKHVNRNEANDTHTHNTMIG
jgi:hypothetical protein